MKFQKSDNFQVQYREIFAINIMSEIPIEPDPSLSPTCYLQLTEICAANVIARFELFNKKGTHEYW